MAFFVDFEWPEVGGRIRARRLAQNRTQQNLASEAELTQNAIFRLEAGETNPQIDTLRAVAKALGASVRELVCGVTDAEPQVRDRLNLMRRILESGDGGAIRIMDHGLESAQMLLDRTSRIKEREPRANPVVRNGKLRLHLQPDKDLELLLRADPELQAETVLDAVRRSRNISNTRKGMSEGMTRKPLDDDPHLPAGNAKKIALPNSDRVEEHHVQSSRSTASARSERPHR
jgi:transcriptional regulator with XRE-family HTH domain